MKKRHPVQLDTETHAQLVTLAGLAHRSISGEVAYLVESHIHSSRSVYASFKAKYGHEPVAGIDYDPENICQDDHEYLTGTGAYSDTPESETK